MNGNLKFFILLIIIIFLIIFLTKKKDNFENKGCVQDLHSPTEKEIFECYFSDLKDFPNRAKNARIQYTKKIADRIKMYFAKLYYYNLEEELRAILIFVPAIYNPNENLTISFKYKMKDFMENGWQSKNFRIKDYIKNEKPIIKTIGSDNLPKKQFHGVFVGLGIRILISSSENVNCTSNQRGPYSSSGNCVPPYPDKYYQYMSGPEFYDWSKIFSYVENHFTDGHDLDVFRHQGDPATAFKDWDPPHHRSDGCGPDRRGQGWVFWSVGVDKCMSSCYLISRSTCYKAYGDSNIKKIRIIIEPGFFNKFYNCSENDKNIYRSEFGLNNLKSIDDYINKRE